MGNVKLPARHLASLQALGFGEVVVNNTAVIDDFDVVFGYVDTTPLVDVACPKAVITAASSSARLRALYARLTPPGAVFALMPEPGMERDAQDLLNEITRVGILPLAGVLAN